MRADLRSNLEPGTPRWATRRALWRALGLTDADLLKPKVAVVNSSSDLAICFSHLDGIAARVKQVVRAAGGVPFEIRTTAPSDFITSMGHRSGYILSARDLIPTILRPRSKAPCWTGWSASLARHNADEMSRWTSGVARRC